MFVQLHTGTGGGELEESPAREREGINVRILSSIIVLAGLLSVAPVAKASDSPRLGAGHDIHSPGTTSPYEGGRQDDTPSKATLSRIIQSLQASIEAAGGVAVQTPGEVVETGSQGDPLGGYVEPFLAADLDGDGDQEVVVQQQSDYSHVAAIDDGALLWSEQQSERTYVIGAVPANLFPDGGQEVLLAMIRLNPDRLLFAAAGVGGIRWVAAFPGYDTVLAGVVEADGDGEDELAFRAWDFEEAELSIDTYDGESGDELGSFRSTFDRLVDGYWGSQGFVTDGPPGSADEAVFVTPLGTGYYAERLSLADGSQTGFNVVVNAETSLSQGADYTGDGRRDGYLETFAGSGPGRSHTVGVFDPVTLAIAWTRTLPYPESGFARRHDVGDANGDGGEDFCLFAHEDDFDVNEQMLRSSTSSFACYAGATGVDLWSASRSNSSPPDGYAHTYGWALSDLNGDAVTDPLLHEYSGVCPNGIFHCDFQHVASAHDGMGGGPIWETDDPDVVAGLHDENLDGVSGHDVLQEIEGAVDEGEARFRVVNGLTLSQSWQGSIATGLPEADIVAALDPDLDGDGTPEALISAIGFRGIGEPTCEVFDGEEECYYDEYEVRALVAAFEPGNGLLWQMEL